MMNPVHYRENLNLYALAAEPGAPGQQALLDGFSSLIRVVPADLLADWAPRMKAALARSAGLLLVEARLVDWILNTETLPLSLPPHVPEGGVRRVERMLDRVATFYRKAAVGESPYEEEWVELRKETNRLRDEMRRWSNSPMGRLLGRSLVKLANGDRWDGINLAIASLAIWYGAKPGNVDAPIWAVTLVVAEKLLELVEGTARN